MARRPGRRVRRGQLVVFRGPLGTDAGWHWPRAPHQHVLTSHWLLGVERAVAVAGDPVPPGSAAVTGAAPGDRVPGGKLLVLGDGPASVGSCVWGYLPAEQVVGVVIRRRPARPEGPPGT